MHRSHNVPIYIVAASLMWVGGFVDALGFPTLRRMYLGNMSGDAAAVDAPAGGRPAHDLHRSRA